MHFYRTFGLIFASPREIGSLEAAAAPPASDPDVRISFAAVPAPRETIDYLGLEAAVTEAGFYLEVPQIARFLISEGRRIVVSPAAPDTWPAACDYLLGTCMGALLHQRGYVPLHANLLGWNGRAYAFAGVSGAGKSTLAASLAARGYDFLSDDLCAVSWDASGRAVAWPGIPRVKLWRDAVAELAVDAKGLKPLSWTADKFEAPLRYTGQASSLPLAAVYELRNDDGAERGVHPLSGMDAANVLIAHTYRRRLADLQGHGARYLRDVLELAGTVPVLALQRQWGYGELEKDLATIEYSIRRADATLGGDLGSSLSS